MAPLVASDRGNLVLISDRILLGTTGYLLIVSNIPSLKLVLPSR